MQTVASYFFKVDLNKPDADQRAASIEREITKWLKGKGATAPNLHEGGFKSLTRDSEGRFTRGRATSSLGTITNTTLIETAHTGQTFTTNVQIINDNSSVTVFLTLNVANEQNIIAPHLIYPRCPKIVRSILNAHNDWTFGGNPVPTGEIINATGDIGAAALCKILTDTRRNFPIIVASIDQEEQVWNDLTSQVAWDLVGLAQVATVDEEGSWTMTAELGKGDSCYLGAVRLYWPVTKSNSRNIRGTVWTPKQLRAYGTDNAGMKRFQSMLRGRVMSAAALTITPPSSIRTILTKAISEKVSNAERTAVEKGLNSIVDENENLVGQLRDANEKIADLEGKLYNLRKKIEKLEDSERDPDDNDETDDEIPPNRGDVIYYKKIGTGGGIDVLVRTNACNHKESSWQSAFRADQAEKGIAKLESRNDWQSIQHCGACTGGGRWRVRW